MIWHESGREDVDRLMETGIEEMGSGRLRESIATFARIVGLAPEFAEGWNKRATAYYLAGELDASIRDVERTLALEPRHFGALSGLGLIYLARDDELGALRAFEATLKGASTRARGPIPRPAPAREAQGQVHLTGRRRAAAVGFPTRPGLARRWAAGSPGVSPLPRGRGQARARPAAASVAAPIPNDNIRDMPCLDTSSSRVPTSSRLAVNPTRCPGLVRP